MNNTFFYQIQEYENKLVQITQNSHQTKSPKYNCRIQLQINIDWIEETQLCKIFCYLSISEIKSSESLYAQRKLAMKEQVKNDNTKLGFQDNWIGFNWSRG